MAKILTRCPVCESALNVSELHCKHCKTTVHGSFDSCRFCRLPLEQLAFIELFLRCEGNLSRVEKELNLSYPTVRNRLQAALTALGFAGEPAAVSRRDVSFDDLLDTTETAETASALSPEAVEQRRNVLQALAQGELSAAEAAESLRDLT